MKTLSTLKGTYTRFLALALRPGEEIEASRREMGKEVGLSAAVLQMGLNELRRHGLVEGVFERGKRQPFTYKGIDLPNFKHWDVPLKNIAHLTPAQRCIYLYANGGGREEDMESVLGLHESTVRLGLEVLYEEGLLEPAEKHVTYTVGLPRYLAEWLEQPGEDALKEILEQDLEGDIEKEAD